MAKLILITGACRSGKSRYAIEKAKQDSGKVLYMATCQPSDEEMRQRVEKHRKERPAHWDTLEDRWDLDQILTEKRGQYDCFLLDCVTMWVSYWMMQGASDVEILEKTDRFIPMIKTVGAGPRARLSAKPRACPDVPGSHALRGNLSSPTQSVGLRDVGASLKLAPTMIVVAVTNEVGWGVVPESESGRRFRDLAGMVNQKLAQAADEVVLMVAGIPMVVKQYGMKGTLSLSF